MKTLRIGVALAMVPALAFGQASRKTRVDSTHAEDAAHTSGDDGAACYAVRNDAGTALAGTTGDYIPLTTNNVGALYVTTTGGAPAPGYVEDAAETAGATLSMAGCVVRAGKTGSTATAADNATCNVTTEGGLWGASDQIEDVAETAATPLAMAGTVRRDTAASSAGTAGDNATLNTDSTGQLWVTGTQIEDVAETAGTALSMAGAVRRDTAASSGGADGDNVTLNTDATGHLWVTAEVTTVAGTVAVVEDAGETAAGNLLPIGAVRRDTLASSGGTDGDNVTINTNAVGALYTIATGATALTCGRTDVPATGTAVNVAANACKQIVVSCPTGNTSDCYLLGGAGNGVTGGAIIGKGDEIVLALSNTNLLWVDAGTNGDDVSWCCVN